MSPCEQEWNPAKKHDAVERPYDRIVAYHHQCSKLHFLRVSSAYIDRKNTVPTQRYAKPYLSSTVVGCEANMHNA